MTAAEDLGRPIETFQPPSLGKFLATHAMEALGVGMAGGILIAAGSVTGDRVLLVIGLCVYVAAFVGLAIRGRNAIIVRVHEQGVEVRGRNQRRVVFWRNVGDLRVAFIDFKTRGGVRQLDYVDLFPDGQPPLRLDHRLDGIRRLIPLVEERTSDPIGERAHASLEAGQVFSFGRLHLRKEGFVIHNETIPWRDLERFDAESGVVWGTFVSAGRHELGDYESISSARALMNLSAQNAKWEGRTVEVPGAFVAVETSRRARRSA